MIKVLNLYSGLGGNRKLWENVDVTAVEDNPEIAAIYQDFFLDDTVIVGDAHQYLLEHYNDGWDFIWASPPCPSHSDIRRCGVHHGQYKALYPDMSLYQEIILLQNFVKCRYTVENVKPYYMPLIPAQEVSRHLFWSNFYINTKEIKTNKNINAIDGTYPGEVYGFNIDKYNIENRRKILRNMVNPKLGKAIFDAAFKNIQLELI